MSALVDEAIKLCRAEELKLAKTIRQYKDILGSMKTRVKDSSEVETSVKDNDIPLTERQEVELLEKALKKALKIRSSSAVGSNYQEKPRSSGSNSKAPAVKDGDKIRNPQTSSLSSSEVKGTRQRAGQLNSFARQVVVKAVPLSRPTIKGKQSGMKPLLTQKTTGVDVQIKPCEMTSCSLDSDRGMMSVGLSSTEERTSRSGQELKTQTEASAPKEQWVPSPSLPLWQAQRAKKNKLWNKMLTKYSKPVPERDHFKKRLISTFPTEWASVHITAMEADLDVLTQLGLDLTHCYNAELQSYQLGWSPEPSTEKEYESLLMLAGLEKMMIQVINEAHHLKKDWDRKMAWCHGALCPLRSRVEWHDSEQPCLPPILAYSSEGELEELHSLRLRVAQLKLELRVHQAICELADLISYESSSLGRPSATALRGVYSLLGAGGAQFPSLVLDIDSTQT
ncbi:uncharacterized protein LOC108259859 isoform X1 [Ictalurus punctatus]|uniref:Uncharacterized protein LOC108259859 isoform X1 n=1 Tax=Ictalurus punctatus TaxID=7998 RepID=A0A2D0QBL7_ICTPU|nr:uncharacterized protein LOC108259859 isoform X1 [Ictalurus punctatus]XP_017315092.1 uncharacterized protein LOC108259859 isoform X1 [Ictalurus punctatus]XP_017315112.1 uncharacterized protein LOC108259859 isoform X1 [Ictalurus punctatus]